MQTIHQHQSKGRIVCKWQMVGVFFFHATVFTFDTNNDAFRLLRVCVCGAIRCIWRMYWR